MAIFEDEPGDYGDGGLEAPPAPWEYDDGGDDGSDSSSDSQGAGYAEMRDQYNDAGIGASGSGDSDSDETGGYDQGAGYAEMRDQYNEAGIGAGGSAVGDYGQGEGYAEMRNQYNEAGMGAGGSTADDYSQGEGWNAMRDQYNAAGIGAGGSAPSGISQGEGWNLMRDQYNEAGIGAGGSAARDISQGEGWKIMRDQYNKAGLGAGGTPPGPQNRWEAAALPNLLAWGAGYGNAMGQTPQQMVEWANRSIQQWNSAHPDDQFLLLPLVVGPKMPELPRAVEGPKIPAQLLDKKFAQMDTPVYDPESGRWIQPDPIVPDVRDPSRGPYANDNPVILTDRAGRARREALLEGSDVRLSLPIVTRSQWGALPPNMNSTREGAYDPVRNPNGYALYSQLYPNRSLADILDTVVIHHEGNDQTYDPMAVQRKHMQQNGWADIGYHYIVGHDGTIYEGRDVGARGSHVEGENTGKIGILLLGDFQPGPYASILGLNINMDFNGDNSPTPQQVRSTAALIVWLDSKYSINAVKAHRDRNATECPGDNAMKFMPDFEKALRENKR